MVYTSLTGDILDSSDRLACSSSNSENFEGRIPITILTGYLGAGKTTLINHILQENRDKRIAVILNEFGNSADIECSLATDGCTGPAVQVLEIANGCICCSLKDASVNAIKSLADNRKSIDYVILETTGLADPGNIISLFREPDGLGSAFYIDNVVTVVDAKNIVRCLEEPSSSSEGHGRPINPESTSPEPTIAHLQIQNANVIILNKADLVSSTELEGSRQCIESINRKAAVYETSYSQVPEIDGVIIDSRAFDQLKLSTLDVPATPSDHLDPSMSTISVPLPILDESQSESLETWIRTILWESVFADICQRFYQFPSRTTCSMQIHRIKGRISTTDGSSQLLQGVRELLEVRDDAQTESESGSCVPTNGDGGKIVVIGRGLVRETLEQGIRSTLVGY